MYLLLRRCRHAAAPGTQVTAALADLLATAANKKLTSR
jgi:hypothetical protein